MSKLFGNVIKITAAASAVSLLGFSLFFFRVLFNPVFPAKTTVSPFTVGKGDNLFKIAASLENKGFISDKLVFSAYVLFKRKYNVLQAGTYLLSSASSTKEIADAIIEGDTALVTVTIPEGLTMQQTEERLKELGAIQINNQKAGQWKSEFDFLQSVPKDSSLEGFLFPDTYHFPYGLETEGVTRSMLENFGQKMTDKMKAEIENQKKTIFEIVIMASLIEKEVNTQDDRRIVSGILWKRIRAKVPLQVDATIAYITGKKTSKISKAETLIDSPYNTYKYRGLPLGPISNPGTDSILAAIHPEESDFWFYLSTPDGTTVFSRTLEEHNRAKVKYLK